MTKMVLMSLALRWVHRISSSLTDFGKGIKHRQLLIVIKEVAEAGFPREVVAILTRAAGPRLTHLLKLVERNSSTEAWMKEMNRLAFRPSSIASLPHKIWIMIWDLKSIII